MPDSHGYMAFREVTESAVERAHGAAAEMQGAERPQVSHGH
jgi:hypothetical protein